MPDYNALLEAMPEDELLARVIYGECRGGDDASAIAWVVRNRVDEDLNDDGLDDWWGEGYDGVLLKKYQFSCLNYFSKNKNILVNFRRLMDVQEGDPRYDRCLKIARGVMSGELPDPTGGATGYHADYCRPSWADKCEFLCKIGKHLFYRTR